MCRVVKYLPSSQSQVFFCLFSARLDSLIVFFFPTFSSWVSKLINSALWPVLPFYSILSGWCSLSGFICFRHEFDLYSVISTACCCFVYNLPLHAIWFHSFSLTSFLFFQIHPSNISINSYYRTVLTGKKIFFVYLISIVLPLS